MLTKLTTLLLVLAVLLSVAAFRQSGPPTRSTSPEYTSDGQLKFPENYREWVYLTSGFDMSYNPAQTAGHDMFDNVFVNPESYKAFLETGTWPDKTMLVLEVRAAKNKGSINQAGHFQDTEVMGREVHVKDEARFPGKWAFLGLKTISPPRWCRWPRNATSAMPPTRRSTPRSYSSIPPCYRWRPARERSALATRKIMLSRQESKSSAGILPAVPRASRPRRGR